MLKEITHTQNEDKQKNLMNICVWKYENRSARGSGTIFLTKCIERQRLARKTNLHRLKIICSFK